MIIHSEKVHFQLSTVHIRISMPSELLERDVNVARARAALERRGERLVGAADGRNSLNALLPAALGHVERRTLGHRHDAELRVAGRARRRLGVALALCNRARNAPADLQDCNVHSVRVERAVLR
jgi:hypothetical protein